VGRNLTISWKNTKGCYGWGFAAIHWLMAVLILVVLGLGMWMVTLDYYHPWYVSAPDWHRGLGVIAGILLLLRLAWRVLNPPPPPRGSSRTQWAARLVHWAFYALIALVVLSGYLMTTAKGSGVSLFGWFEIPSPFNGSLPVDNLETQAGRLHRWLAYALLGLIVLHALAALWHHFVKSDGSLWRILGRCPESGEPSV